MDEIFEAVIRDKPFYDISGGGVTFSGGEPTLFMDFAAQLSQRLKTAGVHTLLETRGLFNLENFKQTLLPWLDMVYFDLKLIDPDAHREYCRA